MSGKIRNAGGSLGVITFVFLLTSDPSPVTGQTPTLFTGFQALRDSLSVVSDTAALGTLLRLCRHDEKAPRANASVSLRSGLVALRLGELGADPDFSDALSSFRRAARREPGRAEPWYGIALAESARSDREMGEPLNLGSRVGLKALERAAAQYQRALAADPTFVPAGLGLADVALQLRDTTRLVTARDGLRRAARALPVAPPDLVLARGRLERAAGDLDSATAAFERYLSLGGHRALGLLELARTRLALGRADGEAPYYEGASLDEIDAMEEYRADLRPLVGDSGLRELNRLHGPARAAYLRRFWSERDQLELRPDGERLREHYRRLQFARTHFPLTISRRFYGRLDAYQSGNGEVDDRGVIYIRHGEAAQRLRPFVFGAMPNESWHYVRAEGDLLFHFSGGYDGNGGGDLHDYRLVQSVLDLHGAADAPRDQLLLSRQSLSPIYGRMLNWGAYGSSHAETRERGIGAASIAVGTTTDSYELGFAHRLGVVADLIAVGQRSGSRLAHFVFGIAEPGTSGRRLDGAVQYPIWVRLVALDPEGQAVAKLDTSYAIRLPHRLGPGEYLVGRVELPLPPGNWVYRAALQQGDSAGVVLPRDSVRVETVSPASLGLSDIALGSTGRAVRWVTDASDTVLLAPSALIRRGAEVEIYYEVSGAAERLVYRHEITVLRWDGREPARKQRPLVSLSFEEEAPAAVIRSGRTVQLEGLKAGWYVVEVRVTAPDGTSQARQRSLRLINR